MPCFDRKKRFLLATLLGMTEIWRRVRDSNPRYPSGYAGFQDRCHQPLGQLSVTLFSHHFTGSWIRRARFLGQDDSPRPCFLELQVLSDIADSRNDTNDSSSSLGDDMGPDCVDCHRDAQVYEFLSVQGFGVSDRHDSLPECRHRFINLVISYIGHCESPTVPTFRV